MGIAEPSPLDHAYWCIVVYERGHCGASQVGFLAALGPHGLNTPLVSVTLAFPQPCILQAKMAAITKPSLLRLFTASLARRPAAAAAAVATTASRGTGSALLRSGHGCHRLTHAAQRLAALHGSAVVCSAAGDGALLAFASQHRVRKPNRYHWLTARGVPSSFNQPLHPCALNGADVVEVQLKVDGMVCEGCSSRVEEALQKMAGVKKVRRRSQLQQGSVSRTWCSCPRGITPGPDVLAAHRDRHPFLPPPSHGRRCRWTWRRGWPRCKSRRPRKSMPSTPFSRWPRPSRGWALRLSRTLGRADCSPCRCRMLAVVPSSMARERERYLLLLPCAYCSLLSFLANSVVAFGLLLSTALCARNISVVAAGAVWLVAGIYRSMQPCCRRGPPL